MELTFDRQGEGHAVYDEAFDLSVLGRLTITRASHVEPNDDAAWTADLSPVGGPRLGPFGQRSAALAAELAWLRDHWVGRIA